MPSQLPIVGAFGGAVHAFASRVLDPLSNRSLHPLQRNGDVPSAHIPNIGAMTAPGFEIAPRTAGPDLALPPILSPGATNALDLAAFV